MEIEFTDSNGVCAQTVRGKLNRLRHRGLCFQHSYNRIHYNSREFCERLAYYGLGGKSSSFSSRG